MTAFFIAICTRLIILVVMAGRATNDHESITFILAVMAGRATDDHESFTFILAVMAAEP